MAKTFPYLEVSGTYQDLGFAIGQKFKNQLQQSLKIRQQKISNYPNYLKLVEPYFKLTERFFPQYIEEARALSLAADIPLLDFFLMNTREIFEEASGHCTIAVSFNNGAVVGHNEDWDNIEAINHLYVLKATVNGTTFLGLQYIGALGVSATMNNWGLVQCINGLSAGVAVGVPKNFIARAILEAKSLDEAEKIIRTAPCASGFNHVLVQNHEVRNFELSGNLIGETKLINHPFVHTNHFLTPELQNHKELESPSSRPRYARAKELARNNMSKKDMIALLSDKTNSKYPICREDATIGSVILLPEKKEVWICYGHPCAGEFVKYTP